jgi:hypothetical protein
MLYRRRVYSSTAKLHLLGQMRAVLDCMLPYLALALPGMHHNNLLGTDKTLQVYYVQGTLKGKGSQNQS